MERLTCKTTTEHYNKYKELAERLGVRAPIADTPSFFIINLGYRLDEVLIKFKADQNLNNIRLPVWDNWAHLIKMRTRNNLSMAEGVCLCKHVIIFGLLNAIPVFDEQST